MKGSFDAHPNTTHDSCQDDHENSNRAFGLHFREESRHCPNSAQVPLKLDDRIGVICIDAEFEQAMGYRAISCPIG